MSTFTVAPYRWLPDSTNEENHIRTIFYQHWEKAMTQYVASVNQMNAWRQAVIDHVNKYADEQIGILTADYDRQRVTFDEEYQKNVEIARDCGTQNIELFNELQNACRLLEFQIVQLESTTGTMNGLRVVTSQEQMERKKKEQSDAARSEHSKPEEKSILQPTNNVQDNQSEKKNGYDNSVSPISNTTQSHPAVVESSNDNNQSISNNAEYQTHIKQDNDPVNKCPICFMIFPASMTEGDRFQHANEHYADD